MLTVTDLLEMTRAAYLMAAQLGSNNLPQSCRWCRKAEANAWVLGNNHWPDWALSHGYCIAQDLRRNHVRYALGNFDSGKWVMGKPLDREEAARTIERAAEIWDHMPDHQWLDDARAFLAASEPPPAPDHHDVAASEAVTLW